MGEQLICRVGTQPCPALVDVTIRHSGSGLYSLLLDGDPVVSLCLVSGDLTDLVYGVLAVLGG